MKPSPEWMFMGGKMPTPVYKSNCCNEYVTHHDDKYDYGTTQYYVCKHCDKACDVYDPASRQTDEEMIKLKYTRYYNLCGHYAINGYYKCDDCGAEVDLIDMNSELIQLRKVAEAAESYISDCDRYEDSWDEYDYPNTLKDAINKWKENKDAK